MPNIIGKDGPYISKSSKPTEYLFSLRAKAIFAAIVDLPTPPLPEAIAMIFLILFKLN